MEKIKNWAATTFGVVGMVIWYLLSFVFNFAPLVILHFSFWINLILIIVMTSVPFLNIIVSLIVWIWALVVAIGGPQDVFAIIYYVVFAINAISVFDKIYSAFRR